MFDDEDPKHTERVINERNRRIVEQLGALRAGSVLMTDNQGRWILLDAWHRTEGKDLLQILLTHNR